MSKGLRNMTKEERKEAIIRRVNSQIKGLGYWGACDAQKREMEKSKKEMNDSLHPHPCTA